MLNKIMNQTASTSKNVILVNGVKIELLRSSDIYAIIKFTDVKCNPSNIVILKLGITDLRKMFDKVERHWVGRTDKDNKTLQFASKAKCYADHETAEFTYNDTADVTVMETSRGPIIDISCAYSYTKDETTGFGYSYLITVIPNYEECKKLARFFGTIIDAMF